MDQNRVYPIVHGSKWDFDLFYFYFLYLHDFTFPIFTIHKFYILCQGMLLKERFWKKKKDTLPIWLSVFNHWYTLWEVARIYSYDMWSTDNNVMVCLWVEREDKNERNLYKMLREIKEKN